MLTTHTSRTALFVLAALIAPAAAALAGPLTPPAGPVAPTMKTLQQVEPRIAIGPETTPGNASAVYRISQPGNYYLTGDVVGVAGKHGIEIDANDVTIDLSGFTIRGVPGAHFGVTTRLGQDEAIVFLNINVRNGVVVGWPLVGVSLLDVIGGRVSDLTLRGNSGGLFVGTNFAVSNVSVSGITGVGISAEAGSMITGCVVKDGARGFSATASILENCAAHHQTVWGFEISTSILRDCHVTAGTSGGIDASGSRVEGCRVSGVQTGIRARSRTSVEGCKIEFAYHCGVRVTDSNCRVIGNHITESGFTSAPNAAIYVAPGVQNTHIEGNTGTANGRAIFVEGTNNLVVRNSFGRPQNNQINFYIAAGNRVAPIISAGTNANLVSSASGNYAGSFTATDPNANISY